MSLSLAFRVLFDWPNESMVFSSSRVQEHGGETIIPFSGILERNLADMSPEDAAKYCEENKIQRFVIADCEGNHFQTVYLTVKLH